MEDLDEKLNSTQEIFNRLTQNGKVKGIYLKDNQLYINATYIESGAIVIRDENGEIIFKADLDNREVQIDGDFISIGGSALTEAVQEAKDTANNALEEARNIKIGGRNFLLETAEIKTTTFTGSDNDAGSAPIYYLFSDYAIEKIKQNNTVTISFDWKAEGTPDGRFHVQTAYNSYAMLTPGYIYISNDNNSGHYEATVTINTTIDFDRIRVIGAESHSTLTVSNLKIESGNKATDWSPAPEDTETYADNLAADLQDQIDGKVQTYSQTSDPSSSWTTTDLKTQHTGDLWYNPNTKLTKRWSGTAWVTLESAEAEEASELAQTKAQIFISTPTVPYYSGDLWFNSASSDIMTCIRDRTSGSYSSSDWQKRNKYTDDSAVEDLDNSLTQKEVFDRITNNGAAQGIVLRNGQLYINASYIASGQLKVGGSNNTDGEILVYNSSGTLIGSWNASGFMSKGNYFAVDTGGQTYASLFHCTKLRMAPTPTSDILNINTVKSNYSTAIIMGRYASGSGLSGNSMRIGYGTTGDPQNIYSIDIGKSGTTQSITVYGDAAFRNDLRVYGEKNRTVKTENFGQRLLSSYEMTSPMFGDIGTAKTDEGGECIVTINDIFYETINSGVEYQVFLQKEGSGDIWVEDKQKTYFIVNGTPNLKFSWEIKVKQKGYEYRKMELDSEEDKSVFDDKMLPIRNIEELEEILYEAN